LETPFPGLQIDCLKVFGDGELYSGTADGVLRSSNASPNHLSSFASLCFFTLSCASWKLLDYWCLRELGLAAVRFWDTNQRMGELVELLGGKGPSFECFKAERPPLRPWRHAEETICPASCGSYLATACVSAKVGKPPVVKSDVIDHTRAVIGFDELKGKSMQGPLVTGCRSRQTDRQTDRDPEKIHIINRA